jgi:hypothetical protein
LVSGYAKGEQTELEGEKVAPSWVIWGEQLLVEGERSPDKKDEWLNVESGELVKETPWPNSNAWFKDPRPGKAFLPRETGVDIWGERRGLLEWFFSLLAPSVLLWWSSSDILSSDDDSDASGEGAESMSQSTLSGDEIRGDDEDGDIMMSFFGDAAATLEEARE